MPKDESKEITATTSPPDDEFIPITEAAKLFDVRRGNIMYFIEKCNIPTRKFSLPTTVVKKIQHVHLPSLQKAKDERQWKKEESRYSRKVDKNGEKC